MEIHRFSGWRKTKNQFRAVKPEIGMIIAFVNIIRYLLGISAGNSAGNSQIFGWDIL